MLRTARITAVLLRAAADVSAATQEDGPLTDPAADGRELLWSGRVESEPMTVGFCVVNVGITMLLTGKAALSINEATESCVETKTTDDKLTCSAQITGVLFGLSYIAAFLAAAAADCMASITMVDHKAILRAACAADSAAMIGGFNLINTAGISVYSNCVGKDTEFSIPDSRGLRGDAALRLNDQSKGLQPKQRHMFAELGKNFTQMYQKLDVAERRLQEKKGKLPKPIAAMKKAIKKAEAAVAGENKSKTLIAEARTKCALDIGQITLILTRAGLILNSAIEDCTSAKLFEGGSKQQAKCTAEITRLILSLIVAGAGIAFAVDDCPELLSSTKATCANAIRLLVDGVLVILAASASFTNTCAPVSDLQRLSGANESSLSEHLV